MEETLFTKIINRQLPADIVYQDDQVTAFRDINPRLPIHLLIVPNKAIPTADDIVEADEALLGRMLIVASQLARSEGVGDSGYRLIINCKDDGRQEVPHLHMHLVGGDDAGPMLVRKPA